MKLLENEIRTIIEAAILITFTKTGKNTIKKVVFDLNKLLLIVGTI